MRFGRQRAARPQARYNGPMNNVINGRRAGWMWVALLLGCFMSTGCLLTKIVSVPLRVAGAVVSIVPIAGNQAHDAIDATADTLDELPF